MDSPSLPAPWSRRAFVARAAAVAGLGVAGPDAWMASLLAQAQAPPCAALPPGDLLRLLPLFAAGAADVPTGTLVGGNGLDARLYTDLSPLTPKTLVTATDDVFVRTAAPPAIDTTAARWTVAVQDLAGRTLGAVTAAELIKTAVSRGPHLIECAGNSNPQNFGLMSAPTWDGVPLAALLARWPRPAGATALLVSGRDHDNAESTRSLPGASWVLPVDRLTADGAFLATGMNGAPLTAHHGAPVRLVVPGWYGCAWIKWVDELRWVGADAPSTTQMLEFAFRTHQTNQGGIPERAADYEAPEIDTAAMPIRVEQRRVGGRLVYDVVGLVWGGARPVDQLLIRVESRDRGTPVRVCPAPSNTATWALWTYRWTPDAPGYYDITLKAADPAVRTRRLDLSFYIRRVRVDEI